MGEEKEEAQKQQVRDIYNRIFKRCEEQVKPLALPVEQEMARQSQCVREELAQVKAYATNLAREAAKAPSPEARELYLADMLNALPPDFQALIRLPQRLQTAFFQFAAASQPTTPPQSPSTPSQTSSPWRESLRAAVAPELARIETPREMCDRAAQQAPTPEERAALREFCDRAFPLASAAISEIALSQPVLESVPTDAGPFDTGAPPPEELGANQMANFLLEERYFEIIFLLLKCRSVLKRTMGHKHIESIHIYRQVKELYIAIYHYNDATADRLCNNNLDWAKKKGLITLFVHTKREKIRMTQRGEDVIDALERRGINYESLEQRVKVEAERRKREIKFAILSGQPERIEQLRQEYGFTEAYLRELEVEVEQQTQIVEKVFNEKSAVELGGLNIDIADLFYQRVPDDQIPEKMRIPLAYVELLALIRDLEIGVEALIPILRATRDQIRYLRYVYLNGKP